MPNMSEHKTMVKGENKTKKKLYHRRGVWAINESDLDDKQLDKSVMANFKLNGGPLFVLWPFFPNIESTILPECF